MVDFYNQFKDFKSFEVVFTDNDKQVRKIFCTVKSIENDRIILDANNIKNHNIYANIGDDLKLYIYTENGIYSSTSKILLATPGVVNTEYVIAYPANSKHSQRREYFRADLNIDFEMAISPKDESDNAITVKSQTRNICGKGMSYLADVPFPEYKNIDVTLNFAEKSVQSSAILVYSKQIVQGNRPKYIHAFSFNTIQPKDIDFIVKKCFLHQLDLRKKQKN